MSHYIDIIKRIRERRLMYVRADTYDALVAFFAGLNLGNDGGLLGGFHEWLVVKADGADNLHWSANALRVALPDEVDPRSLLGTQQDAQERGCTRLCELIEEFVQLKANHGLRDVYRNYEEWLRKQDWYDPSSPNWRPHDD